MSSERRDTSREGDAISLKEKVGHAELVSVSERENTIFDALGDDRCLCPSYDVSRI
jgi:hypothetical protein